MAMAPKPPARKPAGSSTKPIYGKPGTPAKGPARKRPDATIMPVGRGKTQQSVKPGLPAKPAANGGRVYAGGSRNFDESTGKYRNPAGSSTKPVPSSGKPKVPARGPAMKRPDATIMPVRGGGKKPQSVKPGAPAARKRPDATIMPVKGSRPKGR